MTTYKCSQCSGHWTEGPTRDYCETEQCRKCANARIAELEAKLQAAEMSIDATNGDYIRMRSRAEAAECENARLREALERIATGDLKETKRPAAIYPYQIFPKNAIYQHYESYESIVRAALEVKP